MRERERRCERKGERGLTGLAFNVRILRVPGTTELGIKRRNEREWEKEKKREEKKERVSWSFMSALGGFLAC